VEGNPDEAGQARRQMSLHAMWWGYRWSNGGTFRAPLQRQMLSATEFVRTDGKFSAHSTYPNPERGGRP